ncbi:hypothetical protein E5676_scaffold475G00210 [Cucumis melo var. makuwa]|uniref:Uncharacterized protein n=2 Tax=Cucumis melo TaxID=3656 RepID=A0A5A7SYF6_CUCMM|nr:hypothetical protein E6C27_scaffold65G004930 [Cucumis melo var. makuwa]TYK09035.1 hypothetical protein E5676_scaffold475G00210 [Cucumis melo var. makuwa]
MSGEPDNGGSKAAKIVGAVVGFATFIGCVASMLSSADSETAGDRKMMKAPGKHGEEMYRDEFEKDPSKYFRDLRKK